MSRIIAVLMLLILSLTGFANTRYALDYPIPNGFHLAYHIKKETSELKEYVSVDETVQRWTRMLTVQEFSALPKRLGPEFYLKELFKLAKPLCHFHRTRFFPQSNKRGNETALALQYCGEYKKTQQGEVTLFKAIRSEKMYVVQFAWRGRPFVRRESPIDSDELNDWIRLMNQVRLIDIEDEAAVKILHSNIHR